jgi:hypothetical protein
MAEVEGGQAPARTLIDAGVFISNPALAGKGEPDISHSVSLETV